MTQIAGPEVEIDKVQKQIKCTGKIVNNLLDSEIEERTLFVLL